MTESYIGIDIGGSFMKGVSIELDTDSLSVTDIPRLVERAIVVKRSSLLGPATSVQQFEETLDQLIVALAPGKKLGGIGISTAGIVDYAGKQVTLASPHLCPLADSSWIEHLKKRLHTPVVLINDADAASIGAASRGYLKGNTTIGVMPIGTGLGFTVWRNGRKWTPGFARPLLGCGYTPAGSYDELVSASALAAHDQEHQLCHIFSKEEHRPVRTTYINHLAGIIHTANILYHTDEILLGGGLAEAVTQINYPLAEEISQQIDKIKLFPNHKIKVKVMPEGNTLPLIGAVLLAVGEAHAQSNRRFRIYDHCQTEKPYDQSLQLDKLETDALIGLLWKTEQEAGCRMEQSITRIAAVVNRTVASLRKGGRLIYVGAGTSGRLAAIDTVEIACTFGFPRERVLTFIAGGVADASYDIETNFEEDASCVPDLLLAALTKQDVVVGITVSGSAYYVQSALAFAKQTGAFSVLIQEEETDSLPFCDLIIPLHTGSELVAGSTRMKAGTATKKVINFLSTSVMIRLGNVHGCYMTKLECINEKLIKRATHILSVLFETDNDEALLFLEENRFDLNQTIHAIIKNSHSNE